MRTLATALFISLLVFTIQAQELGVGPTKIWTSDLDFQNPFGWSAHLQSREHGLALRVEYTYAWNETSHFGPVEMVGEEAIGWGIPRPIPEPLRSKTTYRTIEYLLTWPDILTIAGIDLGVGAGLSTNKRTVERVALTSTNMASFNGKSMIGASWFITVSRVGVFLPHLKAELRFIILALTVARRLTSNKPTLAGYGW